MRVEECLLRNKDKQSIAYICDGKTVTYQEVYRQACSLAVSIEEKRKVIGIYMENSVEYIISYFGILLSNNIIFPINTRLKPNEVNHLIEKCEVETVIAKPESIEYLKQIIPNVHVLNIEEIPQCDTDNIIFDLPESEKDLALLMTTSGTTFDPKIVPLTHRNLMSNLTGFLEIMLNFRGEDGMNSTELLVLPIYSIMANSTQMLPRMWLGDTLIIYHGVFDPKTILEIIQTYRVSVVKLVPSWLRMFASYCKSVKPELPGLRSIVVGGEPMSDDLNKFAQEIFPTTIIYQGYGMSETSSALTGMNMDTREKKKKSVGKALKGVQIRIKTQKAEHALNEVGEIMVKGPNVIQGYYKDKKPILEAGWLATGDIGYMDEEGYVYITGRAKNVIITGGLNIYPEEIESVLLEIENIKEVLVYGENDPIYGEVVAAKLVLKDKSLFNRHEIESYLLKKLANYKLPTKFTIVDELEKTATNKIKRINS